MPPELRLSFLSMWQWLWVNLKCPLFSGTEDERSLLNNFSYRNPRVATWLLPLEHPQVGAVEQRIEGNS